MKSLAAWLVIAVTAVSLLAPEPVQAASSYFSLTTSRTFLPGEKITVHLYTNNVQALEFRLYRINDPVAFFEKLDDVHGFGRMARTSPREQIDKPTLLERFHDWKQGLKRNVREFFRSQFSTRSRAEIREARGTAARKAHLESATMFAQVPVLNSKQLVARWRQEVPQQYFTESQDVPVEKLDKGVYVVEATDGTLRAFTLLVVSEMGLVTKTAPGQVLAYTVDRRSGSPVSGAQVEVFATREVQSTTKTDEQGLSMISLPQQNFEDTRIIATHGKDVGLVSPYLYGGSSAGEIWMGYLYTDRPVYRPGHTVHFKGILRTRKGENYLVPSGKTVQFTVTDSNQKQVYSGSSVASQFGGIHGDFTLAQDAALGYYSINVSTTEGNAYGMNGGFTVDEYKKPEYEVRVTPDKQRILQGESFTATIEAKYYFGEPVAGADVTYVVHRSGYWSPFFEYGDYDMEDTDSGYDGDGDYEGGGYGPGRDYAGEQLSEQTGKLDANGRLQITIPTSLDKNKYDARYRVEARVTDAARREIAGYNSVIATYGSFQINAQTQQYMYQQGETIKLNITAKDYDGNPVLTAFHADMIRPKWYSRTASDIVLRSADGQTGKDGVGTLEFPAQEDGSTFKVTAKTPEGREIESSTWVWVVAPGHTVWRSNRSPVQIIADKKSYKPGDTAKLLIMTHVPPTHMLVTSEGRTIKSHQVIKTTGSSTVVSVPITSQDEPNFFVSVAFMRDNTLYSGSKSLKVP
ncbi:MAG TPA: MG2 domain-containing protein, partial [Alphaproteobacteria bacterium]|nr:MG2 domain-containing protein [Alphaproteobacteria bacterium]